MGFAVVIGTTLTGSKNLSALWLNLAFGFLTGFMLTAASMVINDYYDREIDAVNEPKRPIPSGAVRPGEALAFAFLLTTLGFLGCLFHKLMVFLTAVIAWLISVTYTTWGNEAGCPAIFLLARVWRSRLFMEV